MCRSRDRSFPHGITSLPPSISPLHQVLSAVPQARQYTRQTDETDGAGLLVSCGRLIHRFNASRTRS
ncbi:hypothetical protein EJ03DRAFT_60044 [Teratosphaeria nubilosa]|uniref:Uncharacterized protein n=1 Tax=Teratosphaeria nubilosa TaxID=161662 RepID=A0A6G1LEN3_9PEZI|nr:hypothetical protein EJ03DRAFT_60044 [Teratosphaeria nubilosa]